MTIIKHWTTPDGNIHHILTDDDGTYYYENIEEDPTPIYMGRPLEPTTKYPSSDDEIWEDWHLRRLPTPLMFVVHLFNYLIYDVYHSYWQ